MAFEKFVRNLARTTGLDPSKLSFTTIDAIDVSDLDNAVVFYHAIWSGPSKDALRLLCERHASLGCQFPIFVIDAEQMGGNTPIEIVHKARHLFGPVIGGLGESCWIRNGNIIARSILGKKGSGVEIIDRHIAELDGTITNVADPSA